jgi:triacylglycerol lipase
LLHPDNADWHLARLQVRLFMTLLTELPSNDYSDAAFKKFDGSTSALSIDNARAMMWTAQLAYEASAYIEGRHETVDTVSQWWGFSSITPFVGDKVGLAASYETRGLLAERQDAVILAFGGTDPGAWKNWATDVRFSLDPATNIHAGFQAALIGVTGLKGAPDYVGQAVSLSKRTGKPLWITGHSLGGALAALAAQHVAQAVAPKAVYTFGMPRPGGVQFQATYNSDQRLGPVTYRFVHGHDVVARIAPSEVGVAPLVVKYRHVGRVIRCDSGKKFDPAVSPLSDPGSDEPSAAGDFQALQSQVLGLLEKAGDPKAIFNNLLGLLPMSPPGPGLFGPTFVFLPPPVRDHLQDSYWNALTH